MNLEFFHQRRCAVLPLAALAFLTTTSANAAVRLPRLFGNEMVLQRDLPVPVWGWAEPGESVTCELPAHAPFHSFPSSRSTST